jgi:predicted metal-dependent peptidase
LLHGTRVGTRDLTVWNAAGDYVINLMLVESKFEPLNDLVIDGKPWSWLYDVKYIGMTTEEVYDALMKELENEQKQEPQGQQGQAQGQSGGQAGQGSGQSGSPDQPTDAEDEAGVRPDNGTAEGVDGQTPAGRAAAKRLGPMRDLRRYEDTTAEQTKDGAVATLPTAAELEQQIRKELSEGEALAKMAGKLPGWMKRVIEHANHVKVNWWDVYAEFLQGIHAADYSWHRFNKRMFAVTGALIPDIYQPDMGGILFLVDCSGSIGPHDFGLYSRHFADTLEQVQPKWVKVVYFDTQVMLEEQFERCEYQGDPAQMKPVGGGGTDFRWFSDYVANMEDPPDVVTVLTDMCGPFGPEVDVPTVWLSTSSIERAPYGTVISIN